MSFLLSRRTNPTTNEREPKYMEGVLEDDTDEFFDAETSNCTKNESLNQTTQMKSIEELSINAVEKKAFKDLQHNFKVCEMSCLALKHHVADAMYTIQQTVDEQRLSFNSLRLEVSHVKKELNRLIGSVDLMKNAETTSAERNTEKSEEKPDSCKLSRLKIRVSLLERDVTKNSSEIVGMKNTLMLRSLVSGSVAAAAVTSAGENLFERSTPNAPCHQPTAPASTSFSPAAGPSPVHLVPRPPPPTPAKSSAYFGPPPLMTTGTAVFRSNLVQKPCASVVAGARGAAGKAVKAVKAVKKAVKTYCRIPKLEEIFGHEVPYAVKSIFFMVLLAIVVHMECNKINYQRQLEYCKEIDSFKCENGGIRMYNKENGLSCWCTSDYVGEHCQKPVSFMSRTVALFRFGNSDVSRGRPTMWWSILPFTSGRQLKNNYAFHQDIVKRLENVFAGANNGGYAARILPPACPLECCANDKTLPPVKTLYNKILKRNSGPFIPDRKYRNLLLDAFYEYFVLQFSDANSNLTVTASQLYGSDAASERSMRSSSGKLKTRKFNYKHYATNHLFAPYSDVYLKALTKGISTDRSWLSSMIARKFKRTEILSTSTMLYVLSTLWAREHNRVCDELSQKWPLWTHEELYTTARKIVTGQMMNIMMTEILNLELRPEMYDHQMENIRGSDKPIELHLMMAVSNLPENFQYNSTNLSSYSNTSQVSEAGLKDTLQLMMSSKVRMVTAHDHGPLTGQLTKTLMTLSREQCLQSFNNYRRRLGLPAYNSFFDLTGNVKAATELEKLYSTVEKVELLTGVLTEKSSSGVLPTVKILSNSFIVNAILTNSLTTKHMWAPDTFGGVEFFDLVKSSSLESLVFRNVDNCDELKVHRYVK